MEPEVAAAGIRHAHRDQRPAAGIREVVADAGRVAANSRGPPACKPMEAAVPADVVAVAARKQAGCTATAVAQIVRASAVVVHLLPVPEPVATGSGAVQEQPGVEGLRQQAPAMALVMTMPAWQAQRPVWMVGRPACAREQIRRGRFQLPFWRTRTCPGRKMHCAS